MDRRALLMGSLTLLAAPMVADAQAPTRPLRIGLLSGSSPTSPEAGHIWQAFLRELQTLGYVEGQNVIIEGRYYGDRLEQLPALAADLARLQVDVIVAGASPAPEEAKRVTSTIPIVMANHSDPVASGLVASLARPGGNVTGLSLLAMDLRVEQLELLNRSCLDSRVWRSSGIRASRARPKSLEGAARSLKVGSRVGRRRTQRLREAFAAARRNAPALSVVLGASMSLPTESASRSWRRRASIAGGVSVQGIRGSGRSSWPIAWTCATTFARTIYVDRILKGARPGDLPGRAADEVRAPRSISRPRR